MSFKNPDRLKKKKPVYKKEPKPTTDADKATQTTTGKKPKK